MHVAGFPRTEVQAAFLQEHVPVDAVVELDVPPQTILQRVAQRWVHAKSGRVYNLEFNPPAEPVCSFLSHPSTQRIISTYVYGIGYSMVVVCMHWEIWISILCPCGFKFFRAVVCTYV